VSLRLPRVPRLTGGPVQIVLAVGLLLSGLFAYSLFQTTRSSQQLAAQYRDIEVQVAELSRQKAELEGLRTYLATDEYIESVARSQFRLVRPGETAVLVQAPPAEAQYRRGERWWQALFRP
jgi:cell division protein FtsB